MSLGTSKDNKPWVCEVHFAYDDNLNIYFRSLPTRRHSQEIAQNPNVAGNIVVQHQASDSPRGVYFEGQAKVLVPGDEQTQAYECLSGRFGFGPKLLENAQKPDGEQLYKITVDTFYYFARIGDAPGQKYELVWNGGAR